MKIRISPTEGKLACPRTAWLLIITTAVLLLSLAVLSYQNGFHSIKFDVAPKASVKSTNMLQ